MLHQSSAHGIIGVRQALGRTFRLARGAPFAEEVAQHLRTLLLAHASLHPEGMIEPCVVAHVIERAQRSALGVRRPVHAPVDTGIHRRIYSEIDEFYNPVPIFGIAAYK